jgi:phosphoglycerate dehydrogenase-like enzyme
VRRDDLAAAVERGGGELVDDPARANLVVWVGDGHPREGVREVLHAGVALVQLDSAGVDGWVAAGALDRDRVWAGAQGAYAPGMAEHALALLLAAAKRLPVAARVRTWGAVEPGTLAGRTVGIVGAGGIGEALVALLGPLEARTVALTRSGRTVPGAGRSVGPDALLHVLAESDFAVLAAPLTPATRGMVGARELDALGPDGWLVNVGRGALVQTDALVAALRDGRIAGACLDVTDPEPLPDGHPLWALPTVIVTPHLPFPLDRQDELLGRRIEENVRRFRAGRPPLGLVDLERGY